MTDPTSTPLPTVDTGASVTDQTVQTVIMATEKPLEAAIIASDPAFATPVLLQIWEAALSWVYSILRGVLGRLTGYMFVDIQEYFALKKAASALVALKAAQQSGDPNALAQANADTDVAITPILHYVGSVQPK